MTIYNPFTSKLGYCELMYFNDAAGYLHDKHTTNWNFFPGYDAFNTECGVGSTRTAQAWWLDQTALLPDSRVDSPRAKARALFGAEYGVAVLPDPSFMEKLPTGGVRFRWLMSTWNPYRVVVMQTEFTP